MSNHYKMGEIEAITVIEDWKLNFNLGNVVKYIARAPYKGDYQKDLLKALWYLAREVNRGKNNENSSSRPRDDGSEGDDGADFVREFLSYYESAGEPSTSQVKAEDATIRHQGIPWRGDY